MDLNAFPDRVLRVVFDRVPLSDLVRHIPLVCHRWHSLQPSVLSDKKAIALTINVGLVDEYEKIMKIRESHVMIQHEDELTNDDGSRMYPSPMDDPRCSLSLRSWDLNSERVDGLIAKLNTNNVTYLDICFKNIPFIGQWDFIPLAVIPLFIRLLNHWARCLKTLKLNCEFTEFKFDYESNHRVRITVAVLLARLIDTVNKLPVLEHLTLDFHEDLRMVTPLDLPILARLKEFYFSSYCGKSDHLFRSLKRYAELNDQLRAIGLGNDGEMEEFLVKFNKSSLAKRFTMLPNVGMSILTGEQINVPVRERFLNTFTSLTIIRIFMNDINLVQLTAILSPLHSLVQLYLFNEESFSKYDTDPADEIRPLPSVKSLVLCAITSTHMALASRHWGRMFPQVQIIMLLDSTLGCGICGFEDEQFEDENFKQQFRRTLKKVYYVRPHVDNTKKSLVKIFTPDTI